MAILLEYNKMKDNMKLAIAYVPQLCVFCRVSKKILSKKVLQGNQIMNNVEVSAMCQY